MKNIRIILLTILLAPLAAAAQAPYWNSGTRLMPLRLPLPPQGFRPEQTDLDGDGRPDVLETMAGETPVMWLDDGERTMQWGDTEGSTANGCLLIDRNRDGFYGGHGDLVIDWVDTDGDGQADVQFVIDYPDPDKNGRWGEGHYMVVLDPDHDNIFNYINMRDFTVRAWDHAGLSDFYLDYAGQTAFLKIHRPTSDIADLRLNWENPFLFYDPDSDGLTEMAVRIVDSRQDGRADWVSMAIDLDNDNQTGNEFDFDLTIGFQGQGFDYSDMLHPVPRLRGLPQADQFFMDPRYRQITHLIYPDHRQAPEAIFQRGRWQRVNFVYDEDDDCSRWERVEFYDPADDPFLVGWKAGGIDNNKQSDAAGDRGEWDTDNSGGGRLYLSRFDGRLHLYGAERGVWRVDQNAEFYQGWDRMWHDFKDPRSFATVVYTDTDGNGFFDHIEYDLDGDHQFETVVDFQELGIDDRCELIDIAAYTYADWQALARRMADGIWQRGQKAVGLARQHGLQTSWYAKWMQARSLRQQYNNGFWLAFYIWHDLEQTIGPAATRAYHAGDWSLAAKQGDEGFWFLSPDEIRNVRRSATTPWGQTIVQYLQRQVASRRTHSLVVPKEEGGHFHEYFCPKHNMELTFSWDKPKAHRCEACQKDYVGNDHYDWAWIYKVHFENREYLYNCMWLYLATGERKYLGYIRDMLLDYASKYAGWMEHDNQRQQTYDHSGKAFAQSLDEASWGTRVAMVYGVVRPALGAADRRRIESGYLRPAARLLMQRNGAGNWQMWHDSGLAALGVALADDSIIDVAINRPGYGYRHMVRTMKNADGWINEGSPHYHYYPLEALLFTAQAVRCRGIDLFDRDMHDMLAQPVKGVYPDLSWAAHSDGWYGANLLSQTALYELAAIHYPDTLFTQVLAKSYARKQRLCAEALLSGRDISPDPTPLVLQSHCYDASGFAVLRSGARSLVFKFGGEGVGHGHPDKLSFTLHDGSRELLSDFGTSGYITPDYLGWYKRTLSHSTVLVDHRDHQPGPGRLLAYRPRQDGGFVEGEVSTAAKGVVMRRAMDLSGHSVADVFTCASADEHLYEYVLLFNQRPTLSISGGTPVALDDTEPHRRIANAMAYQAPPAFQATAEGLSVSLSVGQGRLEQVVLGEAPGIPANPTVADGPGAKRQAAQKCYPLILRIRATDMKVAATLEMAE